MAKSMSENLREDMDCEGLLECIHGLKDLDREVFEVLATSEEPLTVDEIAEAVERERSTAYRSIQRLLQAGFAQKEQINYEDGGYYHVFRPSNTDAIADDMQRMLDDWHAKIDQLIEEFREEYGELDEQTAAVES